MAKEPWELTPEERADIEKLLSSPLDFPQEFKDWLPDFLARTIPALPVSQLEGHQIFQPRSAVINTQEVSADDSGWGDVFPGSPGPRIDNVNNGKYLAIWGYYYSRSGSGGAAVDCGVTIDGDTPPPIFITGWSTTDSAWFNWRAGIIDVTGQEPHFVKLKYQITLGGGASAEVEKRWLTLIRIS